MSIFRFLSGQLLKIELLPIYEHTIITVAFIDNPLIVVIGISQEFFQINVVIKKTKHFFRRQ